MAGMDITDLPVKYDQKYAERLRRMSWQRSVHGYARHAWNDGTRTRWASMHRLIWAWEYGDESVPRYIDHINGDRMDNRLCNLRATTLSLNAHNCRKKRRRRHSLPEGVSRNRASRVSPYFASISHQNKVTYLGVFATTDDASAAYLEAKRRIVEYEYALATGASPEPLDLAFKRGRRGRPKRTEVSLARALWDAGRACDEIAAELRCSPSTARRLLRESGVALKVGRPKKPTTQVGGLLYARPAICCPPVQHLNEEKNR